MGLPLCRKPRGRMTPPTQRMGRGGELGGGEGFVAGVISDFRSTTSEACCVVSLVLPSEPWAVALPSAADGRVFLATQGHVASVLGRCRALALQSYSAATQRVPSSASPTSPVCSVVFQPSGVRFTAVTFGMSGSTSRTKRTEASCW